MGQIWWDCEDVVWGRVGGIVKTVCGQCWWVCEEGVRGRDGGIVKTVCGSEVVEL